MNGAPDSVTVVIPTYAQAARVGEAIASALAQTHEGLEVLVMDDASLDDTPAVIERFRADPRLRSIRNSANLGRVANYRAGLAAARGTWVLMLDGDDVLLDHGFVADASRVATARPGTVLVVAGKRFREEADGRFRDGFPTDRAEERLTGWGFFLRWRTQEQIVPHFASLYHADTARAIGFYTRDIVSSDWESLRRLCLHGDVVLMRRLAGEWHGHGGNIAKVLAPSAYLDNLEVIAGPYDAAVRLGHAGPELDAWRSDALRHYVAWYLEAVLSAGDLAAARTFERGVRDRAAGWGGETVVTTCWRTRPSLWLKHVLLALGGRTLLAAAQRAWHRMTWKRGRGASVSARSRRGTPGAP